MLPAATLRLLPMQVLMPVIGMNGVYLANVANGVITVVLIFAFACVMNRHVLRNMDELMVIPEGFGAGPEDRLAFTVRTPSEAAGRVGLRLAFGMAKDVQYQNILGLNILTIRI